MKYLIMPVLLGISLAAHAEIIWDWSFASEAGHFVTSGSDVSPGFYTMLDFSVTASATGGTIGSLSEGDYLTGAWATVEPFTFYWDGSQVTQWLHSGGNSFDWWTFQDNADATQSYDFGWDTGNINDPTRAAHFDTDFSLFEPLAVGDVIVSPIPEPSSFMLLSIIGGCAVAVRRRFPGV